MRALRLLPAVLSTTVLLLTACAESESGSASAAPEWTAELDLRIGSVDDPDYSLTYVQALEVGPDGSMYALHRQENLVRHFSADGTLVGTIGREGEGPGEFQGPVFMGWVADTLWVLDVRQYRFHQFDGSGELLSDFAVPFTMVRDRDAEQPPRASGLLYDGRVHGAPPAFSREIASGKLTHDRPMILSRAGEVVSELPPVAFGRNAWAVSDPNDPDGFGSYGSQPWGDGPLWGFSRSEEAVYHVDREVGQPEEDIDWHLAKIGFGGDTIWAREYTFAPVPLPQAAIDSVLDQRASFLSQRPYVDASEAEVRDWADLSLYKPRHLPGVATLVMGRDGTLWLEEGDGDASVDSWLVLDENGELLGRVMLPGGVRVLQADLEHVWGTEFDELQVPYIVRFRVRRHTE